MRRDYGFAWLILPKSALLGVYCAKNEKNLS
jgi:hypothetical protein